MAVTITPKIVNLTAQVTAAPTPSQLQQSGALVSVGGTTLTTNAYQFVADLATLESYLGTGGNHVELQAMGTTFFAQGSGVGVYLLELGTQATDSAAITALETWITDNPDVFYAYLVPESWDTNAAAALNTMAANYSSATGKTYFFVTTTTNMATYLNTKSVFALVPASTAPATEFTCAFPFYQWLVNNPKAATPLAPMSYRYGYGVTAWDPKNNEATITNILSNYTNLVYPGSEGGLSNSCLFKGMVESGTQASWWYGIDWMQIQVKQALAAAILNGSNSNPPLLYNQNGINTLQKVAQNVANSAVTFGCALSAVISATSFADYTTANPNDYAAGIYDGLSATVVGQNGFLSITFALDAVQFA